MAYLCLDCYETYKIPLQNCPKTSCNGYIAEIDELMLPIIMLLNQKGYITEFCCSGHIYDEACYPYITFDSCLTEMLNENELKELFKELPEPWYVEGDDWLNRIVLRCHLENDSLVQFQKYICYANLKLLEFVDTLPSLYEEAQKEDCV